MDELNRAAENEAEALPWDAPATASPETPSNQPLEAPTGAGEAKASTKEKAAPKKKAAKKATKKTAKKTAGKKTPFAPPATSWSSSHRRRRGRFRASWARSTTSARR
jgi:hypothetical protein